MNLRSALLLEKKINCLYMECPVCFAVLEDGNSSVTLCNHTLCITCLNTIIQEGNNKCPLCREVIKEYYNKGENTKIIIRHKSSDYNIPDRTVNNLTHKNKKTSMSAKH